jgi:hypothetical protein
MSEDLYDVIIYELKTGRVDTIAGKGMKLDSGFYNAEKRSATVMPRLNDDYSVRIVPAGLYKVEDVIHD